MIPFGQRNGRKLTKSGILPVFDRFLAKRESNVNWLNAENEFYLFQNAFLLFEIVLSIFEFGAYVFKLSIKIFEVVLNISEFLPKNVSHSLKPNFTKKVLYNIGKVAPL